MLGILLPAITVVLFVSTQTCAVESASLPLTVKQVADTLSGKICETRIGARLEFTRDGHYTYSGGLGVSHFGHYRFNAGEVIVLFDNGLERSYAISRRSGILFIEDTVLSCSTGE